MPLQLLTEEKSQQLSAEAAADELPAALAPPTAASASTPARPPAAVDTAAVQSPPPSPCLKVPVALRSPSSPQLSAASSASSSSPTVAGRKRSRQPQSAPPSSAAACTHQLSYPAASKRKYNAFSQRVAVVAAGRRLVEYTDSDGSDAGSGERAEEEEKESRPMRSGHEELNGGLRSDRQHGQAAQSSPGAALALSPAAAGLLSAAASLDPPVFVTQPSAEHEERKRRRVWESLLPSAGSASCSSLSPAPDSASQLQYGPAVGGWDEDDGQQRQQERRRVDLLLQREADERRSAKAEHDAEYDRGRERRARGAKEAWAGAAVRGGANLLQLRLEQREAGDRQRAGGSGRQQQRRHARRRHRHEGQRDRRDERRVQ